MIKVNHGLVLAKSGSISFCERCRYFRYEHRRVFKLHEINVKFKIKLIDGLNNLNVNEKLKTKSFKALSSRNIGEGIESIEPTELLGDLVTTVKYMLKNKVLDPWCLRVLKKIL